MAAHHDVKDINKYCHVCGKYAIHVIRINEKCVDRYEQYFQLPLVRHAYAPQVFCKTCDNRLRDWENKKIEKMAYAKPTICPSNI